MFTCLFTILTPLFNLASLLLFCDRNGDSSSLSLTVNPKTSISYKYTLHIILLQIVASHCKYFCDTICIIPNDDGIKLFGFNWLEMRHAVDDDMCCTVCTVYSIIFFLKENSASLMLSLMLKPLLTPSPLHPLLFVSTSLVHYWWFRLYSVLWLLWGSYRHRSNWWVFWTTGKWKKEKKRTRCVSCIVSFCHPACSSLCLVCVCGLSVVFTCTQILGQLQITSFMVIFYCYF